MHRGLYKTYQFHVSVLIILIILCADFRYLSRYVETSKRDNFFKHLSSIVPVVLSEQEGETKGGAASKKANAGFLAEGPQRQMAKVHLRKMRIHVAVLWQQKVGRMPGVSFDY